jgi:hypothetical protein
MKKVCTKLIRVLTAPPIIATLTLTALFLWNGALFGGIHHYLLAVFSLGVLPMLAYPLQPFIPKFKDKGRDGQRTLAMIFSVCGYLLGTLTALLLRAPAFVVLVYLAYLFSGVLLTVINKLFHKKASGHACGIAGPLTLLSCFASPFTLLLSVPVYLSALWASIAMKRHTLPQFLGGTAIPVCVILLLLPLF